MSTTKTSKRCVCLTIFVVLSFISAIHTSNASDKENSDSLYAPGEILIKFKDDAPVGSVADQLVDESESILKDVTQNDNLDKLNRKYKVKGFKRVFDGDEKAKAERKALKKSLKGKFNRVVAEKIHKQARANHDDIINKIRVKRDALAEKRGKRKAARISAEPQVPYLDSVYKVDMSVDQDVKNACEEYLKDPNVEFCQPNYKAQVQWVPNDKYYSTKGSWSQLYDDLWGLKKLEMNGAWDITRGAGIVVAVVDSGVDYTHPDIAANIWTNIDEIPGNFIDDDNNGFIDDVRGWDFSNNDNNPIDDNGHGTHCAGTIAAVGNNAIGIVGVAPEAKIMPLKGLDASGSGNTANLANGIRYAAENGADVISNSWGGGPVYSNPIAELAVKYAYDLGVVVVFAAGNKADDVIKYSPQNKPNNVITVAASSELDKRSNFSNYGSLLDVAAPGGGNQQIQTEQRNILSLLAKDSTFAKDAGMKTLIVGLKYLRISGTSMACPHVAGVAALILSKHPEFTPADVKQVLRASADDIETPGFDILSGAGRVNARKALMIHSVPKVQIIDPLFLIDVNQSKTVSIMGTASGPTFMKYQLFYAPFDSDLVSHTFDTKTWTALGPESFQSVNAGVLGNFNTNLFLNQFYLLKLEVTDNAGKKYSDIREITSYQDNPRVTQIAPVSKDVVGTISSHQDTFAWIEKEIIPKQPKYFQMGLLGMPAKAGVIKIYHGASNKLLSIYSGNWNTYYDWDIDSTGIRSVYLSPNYVVWQEDVNCIQSYDSFYDCEKIIKIATISNVGQINVIREKRLPRFDARSIAGVNEDKILFQTYDDAQIHDIIKNSDTSIPFGKIYTSELALSANSLAYVKDYEDLMLYDLSTKSSILVKARWDEVDKTYSYGTQNSSELLTWVTQPLDPPDSKENLSIYNKKTKAITIKELPLSFTGDYSVKNDVMAHTESVSRFEYNMYATSLLTGQITTLANFFYKGRSASKISAGSHIAFFEKSAPFYTRSSGWMVFNDPPVLQGVNDETLLVNQPYTLTIKGVDAQSDKIDLKAMGGIWPDQTSALPAGAKFTDNGNATGTFTWTPTNLEVQRISFLARDFADRKNDTWNSSKTATLTVAQTCPKLSVSAIASAEIGDLPLNSNFTVSIGGICGSLTYTSSIDYGDGIIEDWKPIRGPISFNHIYNKPGNYTANVLVKDNLGQQTSILKNIIVNPAPLSASVNVTPSTGYLPVDTTFLITIPMVPSTTYTTSVDFGDGIVSSWQNVSGSTSVGHVYTKVGSFTAKIYVKDNYGQQVTLYKTITVNPAPLFASVRVTPSTGYLPVDTTFSILVVVTPYTAYTTSVDFGDGIVSSWQNVSRSTSVGHVYTKVGSFTAKIYVKDNYGQQVTLYKTITVNPYPLSVTINSPNLGLLNYPHPFEVYVKPRPYTTYQIRIHYGDGSIQPYTNISGSRVFTHNYTLPNSYTALVTVIDNHGQVFKFTHPIVIPYIFGYNDG